MTDLERELLEKTKQEGGFEQQDIEQVENSELDSIDKAAILAIDVLRSELENKEDEPKALWRFIRYLTEIEMPLQFIDYTYMLFPGNERYYSKILTPTAFNVLQKQAKLILDNEKYEDEEHKAHLLKIVNGQMHYGYSLEMPSIKEAESEE